MKPTPFDPYADVVTPAAPKYPKREPTPGPWTCSLAFQGTHTPKRADVKGPRGYREVACVYWHVVDGTREQAEANARLIAQAPRMLAWIRRVSITALYDIMPYADAEALFDEAYAILREIEGKG